MNKYHTPVVKLTRDRLFTLDTAIAYKFTHTHTAVHYVSNILAQKQGKKLLCILTDGYPENKSGDDLITFTSIAVWKARQRGIKVFAVLVARKIKQEWMHQMYGKESEWVVVEDFEHAGKVLINVIGKKIAGMMYGN
jgi:nitric oxide reductase activation protein